MCVSTRCNKAYKRWLKIRMFDIICRNMSLNMMHSNQWNIFRPCDCFCFSHANKQGSYKPRSISYTDCVNLI